MTMRIEKLPLILVLLVITILVATLAVRAPFSKKGNVPSPSKTSSGNGTGKNVAIHFHVGKAYAGEYGFDWMRPLRTATATKPGKNQTEGVSYVGRFVTSDETEGDIFSPDQQEYMRLAQQFEQRQDPQDNHQPYYVPVLTLLPKQDATLSLMVKADVQPQAITFDYDKRYFALKLHLTPAGEIDYLSIQNLSTFSTNQYIDVLADNQWAGRLKVLANAPTHCYQADITLVHVWTRLQGRINKAAPRRPTHHLTKILGQALIVPSFTTQTLDLSKDSIFNERFSYNGKIVTADTLALIDYLDAALYQQQKRETPKLAQSYKLYFINEDPSESILGLVDEIPSPRRSVVIFRRGLNNFVAAHETLHAMGLQHSFSNASEFTYDIDSGRNIMDYSESFDPSNKQISTWQWQWQVLWKTLGQQRCYQQSALGDEVF